MFEWMNAMFNSFLLLNSLSCFWKRFCKKKKNNKKPHHTSKTPSFSNSIINAQFADWRDCCASLFSLSSDWTIAFKRRDLANFQWYSVIDLIQIFLHVITILINKNYFTFFFLVLIVVHYAKFWWPGWRWGLLCFAYLGSEKIEEHDSPFIRLRADGTVDSLAVICNSLTAVSLQGCQIILTLTHLKSWSDGGGGLNDFHNAKYILA